MSYASTNYWLCKHWNMLQVLILLILFSDFFRFQAISTRAAIISSWKLYVVTFHLWYSIKCLLHLLIIVYVNIELCCKCWYCWFFFLTYRFQAISTRAAIISNWKLFIFHLWYSFKCIYFPSIYDIQLNALFIY